MIDAEVVRTTLQICLWLLQRRLKVDNDRFIAARDKIGIVQFDFELHPPLLETEMTGWMVDEKRSYFFCSGGFGYKPQRYRIQKVNLTIPCTYTAMTMLCYTRMYVRILTEQRGDFDVELFSFMYSLRVIFLSSALYLGF